ncbi:AMP-binding enzyme-like protein 19 [Elsinoe fawcettii]|nr:AMP-binding enzyme-like protein 19 [Elsinoe fawcettii]
MQTVIEPIAHTQLSVFHGPADPPLIDLTLGAFLDYQCRHFGDKECLVVPWTNTRWTYNDIKQHSNLLAQYLIGRGIRSGDRIAILAGNCAEYVAVFFACVRIGAVLVILNNTYTESEASYALQYSKARFLLATPRVGQLDHSGMLARFATDRKILPHLEAVITLHGSIGGLPTYEQALKVGRLTTTSVESVQSGLSPYDVCNLQFTSGSTGNPKAAMLTHHNLLNNARFIGDRMDFTSKDILCCPPPLFHCFGLVLGLLAVMTHGAKIVYPSESFDPHAVLRAISDEKCTALHGVPAMFDTIFSLPRPKDFDCSHLRTGIIAGAPVPRYLMEMLVNELGMTEFTSSYGLTEASPTCFNAFTHDTIDRRLTTVGTLLPHAHAKIIDRSGAIVPIGTRGELCIAGYQLQKGYYNNPEKTAEAMVRDSAGVLWLKTGDEAAFDEHGYCTITGRFKDIIIRGGENIYPLEIEERLMAHEAIERAVVVGVSHAKYGEVVGAFLQLKQGKSKPVDDGLRAWVREKLGRHKAPQHIFWLGEGSVPVEIPTTGSGKVKKFEMRKLAEKLLLERTKAKI